MSQGTYELPPLNVQGIASDLVTILMAVGTTCLGVAVYGACSTRRNKKWDSVYDGEFCRKLISHSIVVCLFFRSTKHLFVFVLTLGRLELPVPDVI